MVMNLETLRDTPPWEWPHDTAKRLHQVLTDARSSESDRLIAAELAGDPVAMNDQLAEDLLAIVNRAGEPEELRAKAVISFGPVLEEADMEEFDDPDQVPITEAEFHKIQHALRKIYEDAG